MIYTHGLNENTEYVLVFCRGTPKDVIKVYKYWGNKQEWIDYVNDILDDYAKAFDMSRTELSARPVKVLVDL